MLAGHLTMVVAVGCCRLLQTVVNGGTKQVVKSTVRAATISISVTFFSLLLLSAVMMMLGEGLLSAFAAAWEPETSQLEWWMATSGPMSTWSVIAPVMLAPVVSLLGFSGASMGGQLATSLLMDSYGAFGFPVRQTSPLRLGGVAMVLAGVMLVQLSDHRSKLLAAEAQRASAAAVGGEGGDAEELVQLVQREGPESSDAASTPDDHE